MSDDRNRHRLKTLFVSPFSPIPLNFGGAIRLYNLMRTVHEFSDVSIACLAQWENEEARTTLSDLCEDVVILVTGPPRDRWRRPASLVSRHSFQYLTHRNAEFQRRLDELLAQHHYDVVVTEMTQMTSYDVGRAGALRILDLQNIEHELVRRRAAVSGRGARRLALELEWRKLRREELDACRRYDQVFVPSDRERDLLTTWLPGLSCTTVPNTIDADRFARRTSPRDGREVVFIGLTHVDANRDGVCWFVDAVLPHLERLVPDVQVTVVGGNPPPRILEYGERRNIEVTGYVPDVAPYLERASVSIVPLRSGGGTRLKILEGLSAGVPTVSTSIGAEGLDVVDDIHIKIADDAGGFASAVAEILLDPEVQQRLAQAGTALVDERYTWQAQRDRVEAAIRSQIHQGSRQI